MLKRPEISPTEAGQLLRSFGFQLSEEEYRALHTETRYEGYIQQQLRDVDRLKKLERKVIPASLDYRQIPGLSREMAERLEEIRPANLGQAKRIRGISPSALSMLHIYLRRT